MKMIKQGLDTTNWLKSIKNVQALKRNGKLKEIVNKLYSVHFLQALKIALMI